MINNNNIKENKVKASLKLITPKEAAKLLEKNDHNRTLSSHTVARYAEIMNRGNWQTNGDPIRVDTNGRLLDGQHRLQAIIRCGEAQNLLLVEGLKPDCFKTIDTGKMRNLGDVLSIEGHGKYRTLKAAGIRFIYQLSTGGSGASISSVKLEHTDALDFATGLKGYYEQIEELGKLNVAIALLGSQAAATLYYLFGLVNTRKRNEFFNYLDSGADMSKKHPVLVLRNKLMSMKADGRGARCGEVLPYALAAWKVFRKDAEVGFIRFSQDNSLESIVGKRNAEYLQQLAKVNKV